jgi:hypothetical protein
MTPQLEMTKPKATALDLAPTQSVDISRLSENDVPSGLAEEFVSVAKRVRKPLRKMNAHHIEIGRDLQAVKRRLSRGQFFSWVTSACGLSRRTARLLLRGDGQTLTALSTVQKRVPSRLMQGPKLDPRVVKVIVRAAKAHKPTLHAASRNSAASKLRETTNVA